MSDTPSSDLLLLDSVTRMDERHRGKVLVAGSHGDGGDWGLVGDSGDALCFQESRAFCEGACGVVSGMGSN